MSTFRPVALDASFAQDEEDVLTLWEEVKAFERSVQERSNDDPENVYVFYDGPPFATGLPHYGHFVASTLKDVIPRYWTMRGKRVERRFGWDTHGLPIEMEMEKALELSGPTSIREYGVDRFNEACRQNVLRYTDEWRQTITRLGRWVDFDNDYKTMDRSFMESVWWVFHALWEKGLVYQGVRVMPFSWRLSTPLSNFEAGLDYREVDDPAITVSLPLDNDPDQAALLIWTTTPWTLPSNLAVAVGPELDYVRARKGDQVFIVAKDLAEKVLGTDEVEILSECKGKDLVGQSYAPLFPYFEARKNEGAFRVIPSTHVTTTDGTGLVHMAPAYGEDDFWACEKAGIAPVDPVDEEGRFTADVVDVVGLNIKEADKPIIRLLKEKNRLFKHATLRHSYPFCWRSGAPLIYKTVPVWFVKVEQQRERMVNHNQSIHWVPESVGKKRFGNWLSEARDWAISRNRFWGTPLPVWRCAKDPAHTECLGSVSALEEKTGISSIEDIHPHRIDDLTYTCEKCGGTMHRVPEVFDCWFESGAMPYAQVHYPFENQEEFQKGFPAEFIAEGLDQTRGWFYTLLILSTALFDKAPFKNVIVNGLVLAEDGAKMSKSKRNYPDPMKVIDQYGSDALRVYLIDSPVVRAEPLRFSEAGVREVVRTVLIPLRNAWSFFVQYANIDGWAPNPGLTEAPDVAERSELDRWILSVLQSLIAKVNEEMEGYYLYRVVHPLVGFIDDLTNWYIRRSRRRFWRNADDPQAQADKASAYATLYEVLVTFSKVIAPLMPFITEKMYQDLVVHTGMAKPGEDSVHLTRYPEVDAGKIDTELEERMRVVRSTVTLGRALREKHKLKTRQPLRAVTLVSHRESSRNAILSQRELIIEELNVKEVEVVSDDATLAELTFKPNYKTLGRVMGKNMRECAQKVAAFTRAQWKVLEEGGSVEVLGAQLSADDVVVSRSPKEGVVLETVDDLTVALDTHIDEALRAEGWMRETISRIQKARKDAGLAVTDRVSLQLHTESGELAEALKAHSEHIAEEVLATEIAWQTPNAPVDAMDIDGHPLTLQLLKVTGA